GYEIVAGAERSIIKNCVFGGGDGAIVDAGTDTVLGLYEPALSGDIAAIEAVTALIPNAGAMTSIAQEATLAVPAADAVVNADWGDVIGNKEDAADETADEASIMAIARKILVEAHEIERHLHGDRRYWGAVAVPDETNAIESNVSRPFVVVSGNDDWGVAIPICGTGDNPAPLGTDTYFDPNYILVVDTDDNTVYKIRLIYGSGTSADAITANQYTEEMFITAGGPFQSGVPVEVGHDRIPVGYKTWAQV
ncbi:unnamed protein product, partial [marine sediment metagenome]